MRGLRQPGRFLQAVGATLGREGLGLHAAGLAYKTLLSLIPLSVVVATLYAVVRFDPEAPPGERGVAGLQRFLEEAFVPEKARAATAWIQEQVERLQHRSTAVTAVGLLFLLLTTFSLYRSVEGVMNRIHRVASARSLAHQFLTFWAVLTLGPLFLGLSLYLTPWVSARLAGMGAAELLPFAFTLAAFFLFQWLVPNTAVGAGAAALGALVAAVLWEAMKHGFNAFVTHFADYEPLYGGLAAGVILLLWLYLSWYVALLGAAVAHHAEVPTRRRGGVHPLRLALEILTLTARRGGKVRYRELVRQVALPEAAVAEMVGVLEGAGLVLRTDEVPGRVVLAHPAAALTLDRVAAAVEERFPVRDPALAGLVADLEARVTATLGERTLADLIEAPPRLEAPRGEG